MKTVYQLTDHTLSWQSTSLGNPKSSLGQVVRSTFDRQGNMLSKSDYYPFGWQKPGRQVDSGEKYRYGYQGEYAEEDEETGWNSFEARLYDGRIGRWMAPDPLKQYISPYMAMANIPTVAVDSDGRLVIFVAGQHGKEGGLQGYWGSYDNRMMLALNQSIEEKDHLYADGGLGGWKNTNWEPRPWKNNLNPNARYREGKKWAKVNLEQIKAAHARGEPIYIVNHSMGAKFSQGILEVLEDNDINTDLIVSIAAFQDGKVNYGTTNTLQLANNVEIPSGNSLNIKTEGTKVGIRNEDVTPNHIRNHSLKSFNWLFDYDIFDLMNGGTREIIHGIGDPYKTTESFGGSKLPPVECKHCHIEY